MSLAIRPYRRGGWEVDISLRHPDGHRIRDRRKAPGTNRDDARRWGEARQRRLLEQMLREDSGTAPPCPTLGDYAPIYVERRARDARRSQAHARTETIVRRHLVPVLGHRRLDQIDATDVETLRNERSQLSPTTLNAILGVLAKVLEAAARETLLRGPIPTLARFETPPPKEPTPYTPEEYARLIEVARELGPQHHLVVLLIGDAGLRSGELRGLQWSDVDLEAGVLHVRRSVGRERVRRLDAPRARTVPLSPRLADVLATMDPHHQPWVVPSGRHQRLAESSVRTMVIAAQIQAGFEGGGVDTLRWSFIAHLLERGTSLTTVLHLAGRTSPTPSLLSLERRVEIGGDDVETPIRLNLKDE